MSHSYNKIWLHAVWATKYRAPILAHKIENQVYEYIAEQLREQGCPVSIINGMPDHIHCLFLMTPKKSIADIIKQIKGSSSHFINTNNLTPQKFGWQTGYGAFSVSQSGVERVFRYIKNQKQHHRKKSFEQEYNSFLALYELDKNG
jgi:REP element-mobilizing transposase RayT